MGNIFKDMHDHLLKHPCKYLSLAAFCKVMLLLFLSIPLLQVVQHAYAGGGGTFTIDTVANDGLIITPTGPVTVTWWNSQLFTFSSPSADLGITDVRRQNVAINEDLHQLIEYTFLDVVVNRTLTIDGGTVPQMTDVNIDDCSDRTHFTITFDTPISNIVKVPWQSWWLADIDWTKLSGATFNGTNQVKIVTKVNLDDWSHTLTIKRWSLFNDSVASLNDMTKDFTVNCATTPTTPDNGRPTDNCCLGTYLKGGNADCKDFSTDSKGNPDRHDRECRSREQIKCEAQPLTCIDFAWITKKLRALNDRLVWGFGGKVATTTAQTQTDFTSIFQKISDQFKALNDIITKGFKVGTTLK